MEIITYIAQLMRMKKSSKCQPGYSFLIIDFYIMIFPMYVDFKYYIILIQTGDIKIYTLKREKLFDTSGFI